MDDPRYPIGPYQPPGERTPALRARWIDEVAAAPAALRAAVAGLSESQLATPHRDGGWTLAQVAHHLPDSHLNAYARCKLALTEDEPTIKPYDQAAWAALGDSRDTPPGVSVALLDALHDRWVALLRGLSEAEWRRTFRHPEHGRTFTLEELLPLYAWHGRHHVAQITACRARNGW